MDSKLKVELKESSSTDTLVLIKDCDYMYSKCQCGFTLSDYDDSERDQTKSDKMEDPSLAFATDIESQ